MFLFDLASIAANGRAYSEITEASTSGVNTVTEATRLGQAFLADLKDPKVVGSVEVPYFPWLELGDLVGLAPNGTTNTSTLVVHVERFEHNLDASGTPSTTIHYRGNRPTASIRSWLQRDSRPGVAPAAPATGPNAPTGLSASSTVNGFTLTFSPPTTGPQAKEYELHVSTTSGFTPSNVTQRGTTSTNRFEVTGFTAGATYYAKLRARDSKGNVGSASSEVALVPRYVEPRFLTPDVTYAALPLNGSFEALSDPAGIPDAWTAYVGVAGTDITSSNLYATGVRSLTVTGRSRWRRRTGPVGSHCRSDTRCPSGSRSLPRLTFQRPRTRRWPPAR